MPHPTPTRAPAALAAILLAALAGCDRGPRVVVYTSVDDVFARPVFQAFTAATGIRVEAVFDAEATKTTGLYHRLLAERERPRADVFWNSEVVHTVLLARAGVLLPHAPANLAGLPEMLRAPAWTGFAARARVIIYNTERVAAGERPRSIRDLADPRFRGEAAIAEPLFGTTATHAAALRVKLGPAGMEEYFRALAANGVKVVGGNSVVRDRVASGEVKIGLTDTDDAAVAVRKGLPVGIVFPDQEALYPGQPAPLGTLLIPNTAGLIAGGPHGDAGKVFVDYLLRPETEAALAGGESAQIPLRKGIPGPAGLRVPEDLVILEVAWDEVARAKEESVPFLREFVVQ